jgi:hypothetical protein
MLTSTKAFSTAPMGARLALWVGGDCVSCVVPLIQCYSAAGKFIAWPPVAELRITLLLDCPTPKLNIPAFCPTRQS